ncbi:MAG: hypothetical protein KIH01_03840 [Candidatus Freyarchaeota archaeon]|nr:hypothetical protein [Candidatus Jordarchaeia archaeon]
MEMVVFVEQGDVGTSLANILSRVFPAQNVTAIAVLIFSFLSPIGTGVHFSPLQCAVVGITTMVLAPGIPLAYALWKGIVSFNRTEKEKRHTFYVIGLAGYGLASLIFAYHSSTIMLLASFSYFFVTLACMLINFKWKISVHTAGIGGPATALTYVYGLPGAAFFILAVALVWARVKLRAHTLPQAATGLLLSSLITLVVCFLLYPYWNPAFLASSFISRLISTLIHP